MAGDPLAGVAMTENCDWWEIGLAVAAVVAAVALVLFLLGHLELPAVLGL